MSPDGGVASASPWVAPLESSSRGWSSRGRSSCRPPRRTFLSPRPEAASAVWGMRTGSGDKRPGPASASRRPGYSSLVLGGRTRPRSCRKSVSRTARPTSSPLAVAREFHVPTRRAARSRPRRRSMPRRSLPSPCSCACTVESCDPADGSPERCTFRSSVVTLRDATSSRPANGPSSRATWPG